MTGPAPSFSIEHRVEQFRRYYRRGNDRPLVGFFVGSDYPLHRWPASSDLPTNRPLAPDDFPIERYLEDCDRLFDLHEACGGDFIWSASAFWGIPWMEVLLGCAIYADHTTGSVHSEPPSGWAADPRVPSFDPASPWMRKCDEFLTAMAVRSGGRWPIGTTRMRGISDLLSALYGGTEFIMAMMERPDEVRGVCSTLAELWIEFGRFQLERIPLFHGGVGSFYYNMWAPAGTIWHQEDAAALLSPGLYDQFIREGDEQIVAAFPGCIMHQHPTKFVPTEFYLKMGFTALELHVDRSGPRARDLHATHRRILEHVPLLIWGELSDDDLDWIAKLPPQGLAVQAVVSGAEQAGDVWRRLRK